MGRGIVIFVILIAVIFAAGCRGGIRAQAYVEDTHHHEPEPAPVESDFYPWFLGFEMVDSLGIDSGNYVDYIPELDPYIDEGIFEVYWSVDAVRDYIVEYRINDIPDVQGSRLIDAELCGLGLSCNADGYQYCQYNPDFTLMCDVAYPAYEDINSTFDPLDVADMVYDIPETLYFVMQICDTQSDYCESEAIPVLLY